MTDAQRPRLDLFGHRFLTARDIPLRWRLGSVLLGLLIGASFSTLAMMLTKRIDPAWRFVPSLLLFVGVFSVWILTVLLRRQVMQNTDMLRDQQAAEEIQTRLRPELMPQPPGFDLAGFYRSYRHVGGDCYEAMMLDERRMLITIADVSGKGAAAALLTSNLQAILKFVDFDERPLAAITGAINTHLCRHTEPERFVTMMIMVLEIDTRRLTYVNAGHNPALLHRRGAVERLEATSPPLGALEGLEFPTRELTLAPGDTLVLYTDGLSERRNRHSQFYEETGVENAIKRDGHASADALARALVRDNDAFAEGMPPEDDTAIVVIRATERPAG